MNFPSMHAAMGRSLAALIVAVAAVAWSGDAASIESSIVKVFANYRDPDPAKPWTKHPPKDRTGSGVVIEGNRILTNAHVVTYASQVQVQASQAGDKYTARVVAIAPGIDLAVLQLENTAFFDSRPPIPRADKLPGLKDAVLVYGYPTGGTMLSITKGIVSRIEYTVYRAPVSGLRIQVDAAINPGNSGGPAVVDAKMVGLAFSRLVNAQNIGYIIPNEEINAFLDDIADGKYDGKPTLYDEFQVLENAALGSFLQLGRDTKGVIVRRPYREEAAYPLKQWDVVTHIGTTPIDSQGMVQAGPELRVPFRYLTAKVARNGTVPLTVQRKGETLRISVPVNTDRPRLIPDLKGEYPPYFVYGPVVFSKATTEFTSALESTAVLLKTYAALRSPLVRRIGDPPSADLEELVVISSPLFPHKLSVGYRNPAYRVVRTVNGIAIRSLRHLVSVLRDLKEEYAVFESDSLGSESLIFRHKDMLAAVDEILADNGIRSQGSADIMDVWSGKTKP